MWKPMMLLVVLFAVETVECSRHSASVAAVSMVPIRYDLQIQLPTASDKDPLLPTFFAAIRIDFQLTGVLYAAGKTSASLSVEETKRHDTGDKFQHGDGITLRFAAANLDVFENVTLLAAGANRPLRLKYLRLQPADNQLLLVVNESVMPVGRYTLSIERYQGVINYNTGIYYRDAGGFPTLGADLFPNFTHTVFPCIISTGAGDGKNNVADNWLSKTTVRLTVIHPRQTVALSNMREREPPSVLNENWRVTRFVQAPNLAAYMFSLAILPQHVYDRTVVNSDDNFSIHVWTNKMLHRAMLKLEVAKWSNVVYVALSSLLKEKLPLSHIAVLMMNEFNGTHSFGLLTISAEEWEESDEAHRIALLTRNFARQWFGGVTTIVNAAHFCIQEDIVEYLTEKVVRNLLWDSDRHALEQYQLANYVRQQLSETFLAPGESVSMLRDTFIAHDGRRAVNTHCGLKGAQMWHSMESVDTSEESFLKKLRHIIRFQRYKSFDIGDLLSVLRGHIVDSIDLAQVYEFWLTRGGVPNLLVERHADRLRLTQLNQRRRAQFDGGAEWVQMPLWPLRIAVRNLTLPVTFMVNQALELAPIDQKLLALTNVDYEHLYRVNYDGESWKRILQNLDRNAFQALTARSRAQLLHDFCYFYAVGQVGEKWSETLRTGFMRLLRDHYEHFELCELYSYWCGEAARRRINMDPEATRAYYLVAQRRVWPALRHHRNYECGGPGAAADSANALCQLVFGVNCL